MNPWPTKKLGEIAFVDWGNTSITKASYKPSGYLAVSATGPDGFMETFEHDCRAIILSAIGAQCGKTFWVEGKWTAIKNTIIIFSNDEKTTLTKYLFYYLTPDKWKVVGAGQPFITKSGAERVKVILPSLHTQYQIVERLDAIKKAQELNNKQIALADELFQSLIERELSLKNKNRKIKNLGDLVNVKGGKRVPKGKRLLESKTSHPYIRVIDFKDFSVDTRDIKYIDQKTHEIIKNYTVEGNDIYVSIAGTTGVVGLIPEELSGANLTENAVKLILKDENVDRKFLTFFLSSNFGQNQLKRNTYAPGVPKLAIYRLENTKIPLPPLENQRQIVAKLQAAQDYKKKLSEQKQKLQELFNSCLDKAMKGELVN